MLLKRTSEFIFKKQNIDYSMVFSLPTRQTTLKSRYLSKSQQIFRVDSEISSPLLLIALGNINIGLIDPNSPKKGIGSSLEAQRSNSAFPPASEPVKPTALIRGCFTSA